VTEQRVKAIPEGMHTITPHIVVRDAARAAEWYAEALGAEERNRIPFWGEAHERRALVRRLGVDGG
jgi:PhnB protein